MFTSRYSYEISIRYNGTLSDATFIIPLPVRNNSPILASEIYTKPDFGSRDNVRVSLSRSPAGLDWSEVSPLPGYDPWFLLIDAAAPISGPSSDYLYNFRRDIHISLDTPDFPINTMMPVGNETLIAPKFQFSGQNLRLVEKRGWSRISYTSDPIPYKTKIYADFNAPSSTYVEISCDVEGRNYWIENYDESVGNGYRDHYSQIFFGDAHGWYEADGKLRIAEGVYRPEWQTP
jgi:hypothetical protein